MPIFSNWAVINKLMNDGRHFNIVEYYILLMCSRIAINMQSFKLCKRKVQLTQKYFMLRI